MPQTSPTLRWHRVGKRGYRLTAGVRISGPTPHDRVRAHIVTSGFKGNSDVDVNGFARTLTVPAGATSGTFEPKRVAGGEYVSLLEGLGIKDSVRLESAIAEVICEGRSVTYDMKPTRDDPTAVGTSQVADAIIEKLGSGVRV